MRVPAGGLKILRGADEGSGTPRTALRRVSKSPPVSGTRNRRACWASFGTVTKTPSSRARRGPGFNARKPLGRRRVGGAAQKGDDQDEVCGLRIRQVGMDPEPVSRHQVGRSADRQSNIASLNVHIDFGARKVERWAFCVPAKYRKQGGQRGAAEMAHLLYCTKFEAEGEQWHWA